ELDLKAIGPRLAAITGNNPDIRIFLRGDANIHYGRVMEVMGVVNAAGFRKVALITRQPKEPAERPGGKR
ncbi:MAG: biopolymer transporter ExbD, partial [Rhodospirillales bacterium]|nr:biopolymer transporter ExbD [Rhodospirillales bacterium]